MIGPSLEQHAIRVNSNQVAGDQPSVPGDRHRRTGDVAPHAARALHFKHAVADPQPDPAREFSIQPRRGKAGAPVVDRE